MDKAITIDALLLDEYIYLPDVSLTFFKDKIFVMHILTHFHEDYHHEIWQKLSDDLKNDIDIIELALKNSLIMLTDVPSSLISDKLALHAFMYNPYNLSYMPSHFLDNRDWIKSIIQEEGFLFNLLDASYMADQEIALLASLTYPQTIVHVAPCLKNNIDIVKNCVLEDFSMLQHVDDEFKNDESFIRSFFPYIEKENKQFSDSDSKTNSFISAIALPLLENDNFCSDLMHIYPFSFYRLPIKIRSNIVFIKMAVEKDFRMIHNVSLGFKQKMCNDINLSIADFDYQRFTPDVKKTIISYINHCYLQKTLHNTQQSRTKKKI